LVGVQFYTVVLKVVLVGSQTSKLLGVWVFFHYVHNFPDDLLVQLLGGFLAMDQAGIVVVEVEL
jgi:hypothetical protein